MLKGEDIHDDIKRFISDTVSSYIRGANNGSDKPQRWDWDGLFKALGSVFPIRIDESETKKTVLPLKGDKAVDRLRTLIVKDTEEQYEDLEDKIGAEGLRQLERRVVLAVLDRKWREHLYEMDYLKDGIGLRGMGQRDPLVEYQREGYQMYNSMIEAIKEESVQLLFHIDVEQVAKTEDLSSEKDEDQAVDEAQESLGIDVATNASQGVSASHPEDPDQASSDKD